MRYFRYNEQGPDELTPHVVVTVSERYLLRLHFAYWCERMRRTGKADEISEEACIEDFCVVHWAWEVAGG